MCRVKPRSIVGWEPTCDEVKQLSLIMLQDKPQSHEDTIDDPIHLAQEREILIQVSTLSQEGAIIIIGQELHLLGDGVQGEDLNGGGKVQA